MKFILTLIFCLPLCLISAQQGTDEPVKQNAVSFIAGYNQFKEENLHPKTFNGLALGSSFTHSRISSNISEYFAGFNVSLLNTDYEEFPGAVNGLIFAGFKYLFGVKGNENLSYYIGPLAEGQYGTSAYFNWDESHLYFANYIAGGISNRITLNKGNKSFDFNLDIPLFSCIFRPENNRQYKIDDMTVGGVLSNLSSNPEAALPNKNFFIRSGVEMKYSTRRSNLRAVGYSFRYHYMEASNGNPYQNIENFLSYKIYF